MGLVMRVEMLMRISMPRLNQDRNKVQVIETGNRDKEGVRKERIIVARAMRKENFAKRIEVQQAREIYSAERREGGI